MGALDTVFWDLLQTNGNKRIQVMNPMTLFYIALVVFALMITGLFLSVREFVKASSEPSKVKGPDPAHD
jgi:hypothetical protein